MDATNLRFRKENLSPEQLRAVEILEQTETFTNTDSLPLLEEIAAKDAKFLIKKKLKTKDLPKGDGWTWNQSRGRKSTTSINGTIDLCFYKLTTRVRASTGENPGYKLWIFNTTDQTQKIYSYLWCERGSEGATRNPNDDTKDDTPKWTLNTWGTDKYPPTPTQTTQTIQTTKTDTIATPQILSPLLAPLKFHNSYNQEASGYFMLSGKNGQSKSIPSAAIALTTLSQACLTPTTTNPLDTISNTNSTQGNPISLAPLKNIPHFSSTVAQSSSQNTIVPSINSHLSHTNLSRNEEHPQQSSLTDNTQQPSAHILLPLKRESEGEIPSSKVTKNTKTPHIHPLRSHTVWENSNKSETT